MDEDKETDMEMPKVVSREVWLRARKELLAKEKEWNRQRDALSVFLRAGEQVHHAYSTYARGVDSFLHTYNLLDHTPLGRHEDDGPMAWLRHHDKY